MNLSMFNIVKHEFSLTYVKHEANELMILNNETASWTSFCLWKCSKHSFIIMRVDPQRRVFMDGSDVKGCTVSASSGTSLGYSTPFPTTFSTLMSLLPFYPQSKLSFHITSYYQGELLVHHTTNWFPSTYVKKTSSGISLDPQSKCLLLKCNFCPLISGETLLPLTFHLLRNRISF